MTPDDALYPIREVSRLTGVNAITLRAWERRYGLIEPIRTESGHRLYTPTHIDQIKAALSLTEKGIPISQVKQILDTQPIQNSSEILGDETLMLEQLQSAILAFDLTKLAKLLDLLFADSVDSSLNLQLRRLALRLHKHAKKYMTFLEAQLLPRIYMRMRMYMSTMNLSTCRKVWIQPSDNQTPDLLVVLVGLHFAQQGIYPIIQPPEHDNQLLFETLKGLQCDGLVVVNAHKPLNHVLWDIWTDTHPALEFHYFTNTGGIDSLNRKIQCHHYALDQPF